MLGIRAMPDYAEHKHKYRVGDRVRVVDPDSYLYGRVGYIDLHFLNSYKVFVPQVGIFLIKEDVIVAD